MRDITQLRQYKLREIVAVIAYTTAYVNDSSDAQTLCSAWLSELAFIDERDDEAKFELARLDRFGPTGIGGAFREVFGWHGKYREEVLSVFAEIYQRMGYLTLDREVPDSEWIQVLEFVRTLESRSLRGRADRQTRS
jgi:hypothetical protein